MMKKLLIAILVAGLIALSLGELMILSSLSTQIVQLKNEIQNLRNNQNQIVTQTVQTPTENLVHSIDYHYSDLDTENSQVNCEILVTLKETTDDTQVSLLYNDRSYKLTKESNQFKTIMPVSIFDSHYLSATLMVSSNGVTKVESVYLNMDIEYSDFLPMIDVAGSASYSRNAENLYVTYNQTWNYNKVDHATFETVYLIAEINGKQVSKKDMTNDVLSSNGTYEFKEKVTYPMSENKDTLEVYLLATDSYGYTHYHNVIFRRPNNTIEPKHGYGTKILNSQGVLVYGTQDNYN